MSIDMNDTSTADDTILVAIDPGLLEQPVTVTYDSDWAPGNCGIAAGTLTSFDDSYLFVQAEHAGISLSRTKVLHVEARDPSWPTFV